MEEYIRTKTMFGGFTDNKQEIMLAGEASLLLDIEIENAIAAGKPLGRRDIMIKALEIGKQQRAKLDKMKTTKEVPKVPYKLGTNPPPAKDNRRGWRFGLDEIWDDLDAESRKSAVNLLDQGATPQQLIDYYKKKK